MRIVYEFGGNEVDTGDYGLEILETESFEYEAERTDVVEALKKVVPHDYTVPKENKDTEEDLEDFIDAHYDQLIDDYEDYLEDYFKTEAREAYEDQKAYTKNPNAYYGVSRND